MFAHTYQLAFHRSGLARPPVRAPRKQWACVDKNGISRWGPVPDFCWVVKETIRAKIRYWTLGVRILQLPAHPARPAAQPALPTDILQPLASTCTQPHHPCLPACLRPPASLPWVFCP